MKKGSKRLLVLIPLLIAIALCAFAVKIYLGFPYYAFVQDSSWKVLQIDKDLRDTRLELLKKRIRLKIVTVNIDNNFSREKLLESFQVLKDAEKVLLSPVIVSCCNKFELDAKAELPGVYVLGIGRNNDKGYYDLILKENTDDVWALMEEYVAGRENIVFCKTAKELFNRIRNYDFSSSMGIVTDFKLRNAVPKGCLAGYIIPDFTGAFLGFDSLGSEGLEPDEPGVGTLEYNVYAYEDVIAALNVEESPVTEEVIEDI